MEERVKGLFVPGSGSPIANNALFVAHSLNWNMGRILDVLRRRYIGCGPRGRLFWHRGQCEAGRGKQRHFGRGHFPPGKFYVLCETGRRHPPLNHQGVPLTWSAWTESALSPKGPDVTLPRVLGAVWGPLESGSEKGDIPP